MVSNPANLKENLARLEPNEFNAFIDELRKFKNAAELAINSVDEVSAADNWQDVFEYLFPMPEISDALTEGAKAVQVVTATPEIIVSAKSRDNAVGRYTGVNAIGPIPKNCDITFQISNPSMLPVGSTVRWTVRNEGYEAENSNDLGHRVAATGLTAMEYSKYRGTHYMDCVVRLRGQTIAIRRVPVIISSQGLPKRNPPKPAYTKLRTMR